MKKRKVIFSPDDEPYLGRESVHTLDNLIVTGLELSSKTAKLSHKIVRTELQDAACQLIPQGLSLVLSIRELVRQGYLFGALVLVRPLAERTITINYLLRFPEDLPIWSEGWKYNKRPRLAQMFDRLAEGSGMDKIGQPLIKMMNSITHGDPESSIFNLVEVGENSMGYAVSKILENGALCDKICSEAISFMIMLIAANEVIFQNTIEPTRL
jgi:hypothetical protein